MAATSAAMPAPQGGGTKQSHLQGSVARWLWVLGSPLSSQAFLWQTGTMRPHPRGLLGTWEATHRVCWGPGAHAHAEYGAMRGSGDLCSCKSRRRSPGGTLNPKPRIPSSPQLRAVPGQGLGCCGGARICGAQRRWVSRPRPHSWGGHLWEGGQGLHAAHCLCRRWALRGRRDRKHYCQPPGSTRTSTINPGRTPQPVDPPGRIPQQPLAWEMVCD